MPRSRSSRLVDRVTTTGTAGAACGGSRTVSSPRRRRRSCAPARRDHSRHVGPRPRPLQPSNEHPLQQLRHSSERPLILSLAFVCCHHGNVPSDDISLTNSAITAKAGAPGQGMPLSTGAVPQRAGDNVRPEQGERRSAELGICRYAAVPRAMLRRRRIGNAGRADDGRCPGEAHVQRPHSATPPAAESRDPRAKASTAVRRHQHEPDLQEHEQPAAFVGQRTPADRRLAHETRLITIHHARHQHGRQSGRQRCGPGDRKASPNRASANTVATTMTSQ